MAFLREESEEGVYVGKDGLRSGLSRWAWWEQGQGPQCQKSNLDGPLNGPVISVRYTVWEYAREAKALFK